MKREHEVNGDNEDDLELTQSPQVAHILTFSVFLHTSGMAEARVFKFYAHVGHIKC